MDMPMENLNLYSVKILKIKDTVNFLHLNCLWKFSLSRKKTFCDNTLLGLILFINF